MILTDPQHMHFAGLQVMKTYPYGVELRGDQSAAFVRDVNAGQRLGLSDDAVFEGQPVKVTVIDGELPGLGLYVFAQQMETAEKIEQRYQLYSTRHTETIVLLSPPAPLLTDAKFITKVERLYRDLLKTIGEDPQREGLIETPRRAAAAWLEFMRYKETNADSTFEVVEADQMVVVQDIRVWSLCEHHLLPFWCDLSIGVLTGSKVLGLSKFARIAHKHAHKLQIQERLVADIATDISAVTGTPDVAVFAKGVHTCAAMRGIKTPLTMKTSVMRGAFRTDLSTRAEFLKVVSL